MQQTVIAKRLPELTEQCTHMLEIEGLLLEQHAP
jgi:hypothetical protein